MERVTKSRADQQHGRPAAARISQPSAAWSVDKRPETIAQRELVQSVNNSPRLAAQSQLAEAIGNSPKMLARTLKLKSLFGESLQLEGTPESNEFPHDNFTVAHHELASVTQERTRGVVQGQELRGVFTRALQRNGPEQEKLLESKFDLIQREGSKGERLGMQAGSAPVQLQAESLSHTNNTTLPDDLKSGIESLSGISLDEITVRYNSSQPAQLHALAYTQGTDIHVAPGQERHVPHEAWHVVQQAQGRVRPTMQMKDGVPVNDDAGLEHEADVMGARAAVVGHFAPTSQFFHERVAEVRSGIQSSLAPTPLSAQRRQSAAGDTVAPSPRAVASPRSMAARIRRRSATPTAAASALPPGRV